MITHLTYSFSIKQSIRNSWVSQLNLSLTPLTQKLPLYSQSEKVLSANLPTAGENADSAPGQMALGSSCRCIITEEVVDEDSSGIALLVEADPGNLKAWLNLNLTDQCSSLLLSLPSSLRLGFGAKQMTKGYNSSRFL